MAGDWHVVGCRCDPYGVEHPATGAMNWVVGYLNVHQPVDVSGICAFTHQGAGGHFWVTLCVRADLSGTQWEPSPISFPTSVGKAVADKLSEGNWTALGCYRGDFRSCGPTKPAHPDILMGVQTSSSQRQHKWAYERHEDDSAWLFDFINDHRPRDGSGVLGVMSRVGLEPYKLHVWCRSDKAAASWRRDDIEVTDDMEWSPMLRRRLRSRNRTWTPIGYHEGVVNNEGDSINYLIAVRRERRT